MLTGKTWKTAVMLLAMSLGGDSSAWATATGDFNAQAQTDFQAISDYINGQFAKSMGFYSTLGWNNPPGVFDFLAGPRVEVGIGAGADVASLSNLNNLPLQALLVSSNISLPSVLPLPFPIATARVGLFNGLDVGFRLSYIPVISFSDIGFSANSTGWGLDFRYKFLEGVQLPTVTICASWDTINGKMALNTSISQSSIYNDSGTPVAVAMSGNDTYTQNWNVNSFGAKVMFGKDLGMIYPFAAIGFQRNSGTVSSSLVASGTQTVGPDPQQTFSFTTASSSLPVLFEPKYVLGFDLGEGFHWAVVGESNGTDIACSTSFRIQF